MRRLEASLPSSYPDAIIIRRKRIVWARLCVIRSGAGILDAGSKTIRNTKALFDLSQQHNPVVR